MKLLFCSPAALFLLLAASPAQSTLPAGTPLPLTLPKRLPLRAGETLRAELLYPVYLANEIVLPAHTVVLGQVVSLVPDHPRRAYARFNADFTPFHKPVVQFTAIALANGSSIPISTGPVTDGAPVFHLTPGPPKRGGFIRQQYGVLKQNVRDMVMLYTAPGRGERLADLLYNQLPYHPQHIDKMTGWTVETAAPVILPAHPATTVLVATAEEQKAKMPGFLDRATRPEAPAAATPDSSSDAASTWSLEAYLEQSLSSKTAHSGDIVTATVAVPVKASDGTVLVPEGAKLYGNVTQAQAARRFSRAGKLRFTFTELELPDQPVQPVRTSLRGADSRTPQQLAMDSEGNVTPTPPNKIAPLILAALAALPLHQDAHQDAGEQLGKNAVASNSLGLIGFIVGTATQQAAVAGAIGAYGAAVSGYRAYFARGRETEFVRNTRLYVKTQATRSAALKSAR